MEKTNPVLILTKCILHMCEASVLQQALTSGQLAATVASDPGRAHMSHVAQPTAALHWPALGRPDGWPLHSPPSQPLPPEVPADSPRQEMEALQPEEGPWGPQQQH